MKHLRLLNVGDERYGTLLVAVEHLGVILRSGKFLMAEKFRHGIDVGTQIKHQNGKGVTAAVKCNFLLYAGGQAPAAQFKRGV